MAEPVTTEDMENALQVQAHKTAEWVFQNYVKAKPAMSFARMRDEMASDFIQAAREALANRKAGEWRPIAEAPKDGRDIVVRTNSRIAGINPNRHMVVRIIDNYGHLHWFSYAGNIFEDADLEGFIPLPAPPLPLTDAGG